MKRWRKRIERLLLLLTGLLVWREWQERKGQQQPALPVTAGAGQTAATPASTARAGLSAGRDDEAPAEASVEAGSWAADEPATESTDAAGRHGSTTSTSGTAGTTASATASASAATDQRATPGDSATRGDTAGDVPTAGDLATAGDTGPAAASEAAAREGAATDTVHPLATTEETEPENATTAGASPPTDGATSAAASSAPGSETPAESEGAPGDDRSAASGASASDVDDWDGPPSATRAGASATTVEASAASSIPTGAVAGDGSPECPASHPIKGNASSMIYHEPGRSSYARTIAEFCFATVEDAEAAGYRAPQR